MWKYLSRQLRTLETACSALQTYGHGGVELCNSRAAKARYGCVDLEVWGYRGMEFCNCGDAPKECGGGSIKVFFSWSRAALYA